MFGKLRAKHPADNLDSFKRTAMAREDSPRSVLPHQAFQGASKQVEILGEVMKRGDTPPDAPAQVAAHDQVAYHRIAFTGQHRDGTRRMSWRVDDSGIDPVIAQADFGMDDHIRLGRRKSTIQESLGQPCGPASGT